MSYLDLALEVKEDFTNLLEAILIKKSMNEFNRDDFYIYTGKIATIYGHAFLDRYDPKHLTTIFSINELIASLTYSTFSLEDDSMELSDVTLKHFEEIKNELKDIEDEEEYEEIPELRRIIDINIVKDNLISYLRDENIPAYNQELRKILAYGEYRHDQEIREAEGYGDDDFEDENYEFEIYESYKRADRELEYYYNLYDELTIDVTEYYDADLLLQRIDEIH